MQVSRVVPLSAPQLPFGPSAYSRVAAEFVPGEFHKEIELVGGTGRTGDRGTPTSPRSSDRSCLIRRASLQSE